MAVRKAMDYMFSQHDLSFLDDIIPEKDKKKKEDEKKKKKKSGSIDSDAEDVSALDVKCVMWPAELKQMERRCSTWAVVWSWCITLVLFCLWQFDYPYNEKVASIKIPMDMMEQEPFLGDKASDSE